MSLKKEEILEAIANMSVSDIVDLVSMMENRFGVTASSVAQVVKNNENEKKEEKSDFKITLKSIGKNKIAVIKIVRSFLNLGLKEAKDTVDSAPVLLKDGVNKLDSDKIKKTLEEAGAIVELS